MPAEPPEEILNLFRQYSVNDLMTVEGLAAFLKEIQGENQPHENAQKIFDSVKHLFVFQRRGLHLDAFFKYLFGEYEDQNSPLAPLGVELHHLSII